MRFVSSRIGESDLRHFAHRRPAHARLVSRRHIGAHGRTGVLPPNPQRAGSRGINGCLRDVDHAHSREGGLAVLNGNIAEDGCIVKASSVKLHMLSIRGSGGRRLRNLELRHGAVGPDAGPRAG